MEILKMLLEKREDLQKGETKACEWAKSHGFFYAFNEKGELLVVRKKQICITQDGKAIWPLRRDGSPQENLSAEKTERTVISFISTYTSSQQSAAPAEIPMPCSFMVKEITCKDQIFTIWPEAGQEPVTGTFSVMSEALTLAEYLYYSNTGADEDTLRRCCYEYLVEDHQNYLKKAEQEKRFLSGRNNQMVKKENFYQNENGDYECNFTASLWGGKADVGVWGPGKQEDMDKILTDLSKQLNTHMKWIDQQKEQIQKAILDDDMVSAACDWMEGFELEGEDGKIYYEMEDGSLLPAPVTEEMFLNSLYIEGIHAYCRADEISFDLFIGTEPDFFACHSIEVFITATPEYTYKIKAHGLAG